MVFQSLRSAESQFMDHYTKISVCVLVWGLEECGRPPHVQIWRCDRDTAGLLSKCASLEIAKLFLVFVVRQRLQRLLVERVEIARVAGAFRMRHVRRGHLPPQTHHSVSQSVSQK